MAGKVVDIFFTHPPARPQQGPKVLLFENVKGLTLIRHQDALAAYLESLRDGLDNKYKGLLARAQRS